MLPVCLAHCTTLPHAAGKYMTEQRKPLPRLVAWLILLFLIAVVVVGPELFPGNSKLYDAIEAGDVQAARSILESGNDPDGRSRGLDPTETQRYRYTPLDYALREGEPEIAQLLVNAGADPNQRTYDDKPVLIVAADAGMVDLVRVLLEKGADVQATDSLGGTALHFGGTINGQIKDFLDPEIRAMLEAAGAK